MKKLIRYVTDNWIWIVAGCIAQKLAIDHAYISRGYEAVGGEWLVLPVLILAVESIRCIFWSIMIVMEEDVDESEAMGNC